MCITKDYGWPNAAYIPERGRLTARQLAIFRRTWRQPFYFGRTRTLGHLILGVLVKFSGVSYEQKVGRHGLSNEL